MWNFSQWKNAIVVPFLAGSFFWVVASTPSRPLPFPYGTAYGDVYAGPQAQYDNYVDLPMPIRLVDSHFSYVVQDTNGYLSFFNDISEGDEAEFYVSGLEMDIDTNGYEDEEIGRKYLWMRAGNNISDLTLAREIIAGRSSSFHPEAIIVSTWWRVPFDSRVRRHKRFQCILAYSASGETWVIYAYSQLQYFEAGATNAALVGYYGFDDLGDYQKIVAWVNDTAAMHDLLNGTNCNRKGIYAYQINDDSTIA